MDSPAAPETVVGLTITQAHFPVSTGSHKVQDIYSYTKQHSKRLLTPCRQVGLSRKSPRNSLSPSSSDVNPSSTPRSSRFISVRNSNGLGKFNVNVLDKHTYEENQSNVLGKRINLENINEKAKQCKYDTDKEPIRDEHEESTKENKQTEKCNNKGSQKNINALFSCRVSDIESSVHDGHNMSPGNGNGERSIEKTSMVNFADTQQCSVVTTSCKDLGFQSLSVNDTNSVMISMGTNHERAIKGTQIKNNPTLQCDEHISSHKYSNAQSNSSNEDSVASSENMIECTEQNFKILNQQITVKEEEVKRLKLILLYKKKHDVNELATEIARWKEGCQEALRKLHKASISQGYQFNMTRLLEMFGIPPHVVGYNEDTEDFD